MAGPFDELVEGRIGEPAFVGLRVGVQQQSEDVFGVRVPGEPAEDGDRGQRERASQLVQPASTVRCQYGDLRYHDAVKNVNAYGSRVTGGSSFGSCDPA